MIGAGHAADMISRLKANQAIRKKRKHFFGQDTDVKVQGESKILKKRFSKEEKIAFENQRKQMRIADRKKLMLSFGLATILTIILIYIIIYLIRN